MNRKVGRTVALAVLCASGLTLVGCNLGGTSGGGSGNTYPEKAPPVTITYEWKGEANYYDWNTKEYVRKAPSGRISMPVSGFSGGWIEVVGQPGNISCDIFSAVKPSMHRQIDSASRNDSDGNGYVRCSVTAINVR